ncbi:hypothetical protein AAFF_G00434360 [Aldrovandia affinis]|uniref:Uncharacterized protein n=1 Tax=Aldrovandia affinis TaxID=143900 RepID=A0AAD7S8N2_9TELE|nr:hypothetical protein AAFF_G00434360 [Aldrovandia affinis]
MWDKGQGASHLTRAEGFLCASNPQTDRNGTTAGPRRDQNGTVTRPRQEHSDKPPRAPATGSERKKGNSGARRKTRRIQRELGRVSKPAMTSQSAHERRAVRSAGASGLSIGITPRRDLRGQPLKTAYACGQAPESARSFY